MNIQRINELHKFYKDTLFSDVIPFWMNSDLIDKEYGGFISSVDREGKSYNDDKSVWFQGRCLWTFSKLCNVYGAKEEWANAADSGAKFIKEHYPDIDVRASVNIGIGSICAADAVSEFFDSFYVRRASNMIKLTQTKE